MFDVNAYIHSLVSFQETAQQHGWTAFIAIIIFSYLLEDGALIMAGVIAATGNISPLTAWFASFFGIFSGDVGVYWVARLFRKPVASWRPDLPMPTLWELIICRFTPGFRTIAYSWCGLSLMPFLRFAQIIFWSGLVWTVLVFSLVYNLGLRSETWLTYYTCFVIPVALVLIFWWRRRWKRKFLSKANCAMSDKVNYEGMPPLERRSRTTSCFEFWPSQIIYIPVVIQWLVLAVKYRSLSLPLIANPDIPLAGMVGESKSDILSLAGERANAVIAPWVVCKKTNDVVDVQADQALDLMLKAGFDLPMVAKPDQGCRGVGVWKISTRNRLIEYIKLFPENANFILQRLSEYQPEAGVFYYRLPNQSHGQIVSITLKYPPFVTGDGRHTLRELILQDERAAQLRHVYFPRLSTMLDRVISVGERVQLVFAGNHCRGCMFRNGNAYISKALTEEFDRVLGDVKGFYFGRLDVRFASIDALMQGKDFEIIEINGAASEATHIWDPDTRFSEVYSTLFFQYRILFMIGSQIRAQGYRPPSILLLLKAWRQERRLTAAYPATD